MRDRGLLDSALARPENLLAYGKPSVFELAASYAFGLVKNHPFIDGTKRTGFATAVLFLELNRQRFQASDPARACSLLESVIDAEPPGPARAELRRRLARYCVFRGEPLVT